MLGFGGEGRDGNILPDSNSSSIQLKTAVSINAAYITQKAKVNHQRAKLILEEAKQLLSDRQVDEVKLIHETDFLVDLFHEFEQNSDLVILGKRGENVNFATEHLGANIERIVRSSHKPCLVTPREYHPIKRIMLAYDGCNTNS